MRKTAVAFFGFNRPDCTQIAFDSIRQYRPEQLFLVADGPRPTVPSDDARCAVVREIMQAIDWTCEVRTNFAEQNLGCKNRMSSGLDWVFAQVEEAIILEDDCVPCPEFFEFCSALLARYRDDPRILHIGGTNFQEGHARGDGSYYFSSYVHVWGWATWRRAWQHYDGAMRSWPQAKKEGPVSGLGATRFESDYWSTVFDEVHAGKIDTWDYQWLYAVWKNRGLAIIPNVNLVTNIGAGPEATHTKDPLGSLARPTGTLGPLRHPAVIEIDQAADRYTFDFHCHGNLMRTPLRRLRRLLSRWKRAFAALTARG